MVPMISNYDSIDVQIKNLYADAMIKAINVQIQSIYQLSTPKYIIGIGFLSPYYDPDVAQKVAELLALKREWEQIRFPDLFPSSKTISI